MSITHERSARIVMTFEWSDEKTYSFNDALGYIAQHMKQTVPEVPGVKITVEMIQNPVPMPDAPVSSLSHKEWSLVRKAVIEAIRLSIDQRRIPAFRDAVEALWIANRATELIKEYLPSLSMTPPIPSSEKLPLRPSSDPEVLGEQLRQALVLESPPSDMTSRYKGYLAQIIKNCILGIRAGNLDAPQESLDLMAPALHQVERIQNVEPEIAREVWMVQWMMAVFMEALGT